jgi:hypothetical protein
VTAASTGVPTAAAVSAPPAIDYARLLDIEARSLLASNFGDMLQCCTEATKRLDGKGLHAPPTPPSITTTAPAAEPVAARISAHLPATTSQSDSDEASSVPSSPGFLPPRLASSSSSDSAASTPKRKRNHSELSQGGQGEPSSQRLKRNDGTSAPAQLDSDDHIHGDQGGKDLPLARDVPDIDERKEEEEEEYEHKEQDEDDTDHKMSVEDDDDVKILQTTLATAKDEVVITSATRTLPTRTLSEALNGKQNRRSARNAEQTDDAEQTEPAPATKKRGSNQPASNKPARNKPRKPAAPRNR